MKLGALVIGILQITCGLALSQGADKSGPYARVCFAVANSISGEEEAFLATSTPGKGKKIVAHLDATAPCQAVIVAFNRGTGNLAYGWRPQFVEMTARKEVLLPRAPITWDWTREAGPIELHALIFAPGSKESTELRSLVAAMQKPKTEAIARVQTNKLRELMGRATMDKSRPEPVAKNDTEVGGVFRMVVGFDWHDSARSVNFTASKPGAVIFP